MEVHEIREMAIQGSKAYYQYLERNDGGIQVVDVFSIEVVDDKKESFKLKLSQKLFDLDAVLFRFLPTNRNYDSIRIKVVQYDSDRNTLVVRPEPDLLPDFRDLRSDDLKVISDLKFLVERIKNWYENNGGGLRLPQRVSPFSKNWKELPFFPDRRPSANQLNALETIFTKPFSYIWGAPGTGKTQIVLSYALLHYVKNEKKVAILGPTNNAIEQVLRGVIEMTDRAGIERDQILRIGNPTKKFAEEFPEVCEARGLEKQLAELDRQIELLQKIVVVQEEAQYLERSESSLTQFQDLEMLAKKYQGYSTEITRKDQEKGNVDQRINLLQGQINTINAQLADLEKRSKSFSHSVGKWFSTGPSKVEEAMSERQRALQKVKEEISSIEPSLRSLEEAKRGIVADRDGISAVIRQVIAAIKAANGYGEAEKIVSDLSMFNFVTIRGLLSDLIARKREELVVTDALARDYLDFPRNTLEVQVQILRERREDLAAHSTEERLKTVRIVAATLDTYVGRFSDQRLNVNHIFLDEAGYANIVKALTLFHHDLPITFLGDHKQLPPVCELNDRDIGQNESYRDVFIWSQSAIFLDGLFRKDKNQCLQEYLQNAELTPVAMAKADINETYRFGASLARVLEAHVYRNDFRSANQEGDTRIYFVDATLGRLSQKRENPAEVQGVAQLIQMLGTDDFSILTPYRNQLKLLGRTLPELRNEQKILTVHGSQGREWDTVILSVSDTANMWFTDTQNRTSKGLNLMNTAVSRAKKRLILVCDVRFWRNQPGQLIHGLLSVASPFQAQVDT